MRALHYGIGVLLLIVTSACTVETLVPGSADPDPTRTDGDPAPTSSAAASTSGTSATPPAPTTSTSATPVTPPANASANVDLRVSGDCAPDFKDLIVATNTGTYDSLSIANASAPMNGSFQAQMTSGKKKLELSTRERTEGHDVLNVMAGGVVYTNLCNSTSGACTFDATSKTWRNDAIEGRVDVRAYDPRTGAMDLVLDGVVLQSTQGRGLCKLQGTVKAIRLGR